MDGFALAQIGISTQLGSATEIHPQWHYISSILMGDANQKTHTMNNELKLQKFAGFDFKARVKVDYNGMLNQTYNVHEIISTRVTIKTDRLIDFHISEVELIPIGYSAKESAQIRSIYAN